MQMLPELPTLLTFALAALALNITPGADMTFVAASAARGGSRHGIMAALGVGAGALVHVGAATVGLSALIASSQAAFAMLRWVGAAYLLYVALSLVLGGAARADDAAPIRSDAAVFRAAALVNILNPKVGLFILAFLPQFVDAASPSATLQTLPLGLWFNASGTLVNVLVAIVSARTASGLRGVPWIGRAARWLAASLMGALAVKLAIGEKR